MFIHFILSSQELSLVKNAPIMQVQFSLSVYSDQLFSENDIVKPQGLLKSNKKRKADFFSGRWCVKQLLTKHWDVSNKEAGNVLIGESRSPIWPENFCGSITHSKNKAYAIISTLQKYQFVGIDAEHWVTDKLAKSLTPSICSNEEKNLLTSLPINYSQAFTFLFSAKETLFKALFPSVKTYFDFLDAEVIKFSLDQKELHIELKKTLSASIAAKQIFIISYKEEVDHVLTYFAQI